MNTEQRIRESLRAEGERLPLATEFMASPNATRSRRTGPLAALVALVAVLVIGAITALIAQGDGTEEVVVQSTTSSLASVPTTSTSVAGPSLVPVALGLDLLFYPGRVPADLSLCEEVNNPPSMSVTVCDGANRTVSVSVRPSEFPELDGQPVEGHSEWRIVEEGGNVTLEVPIANTWRLRAEAKGLKSDEVVEIVESTRVVANRDALITDYEVVVPVAFEDLTDEQLRKITAGSINPTIVRSDQDGITITGETGDVGSFALFAGTASPADLLDVVSGLGSARLVTSTDRPMIAGSGIVGDDPSLWDSMVYWIQRGKMWTLFTQSDSDSATELAVEASKAIAALPPRTRNWQVDSLAPSGTTFRLGDRITVEGRLSGSFPDEMIWVYLLRADPIELVDYLCRDRPDADGSFTCTSSALMLGGTFSSMGSGEYLLAVGDPWHVVPGSNFHIVTSDN